LKNASVPMHLLLAFTLITISGFFHPIAHAAASSEFAICRYLSGEIEPVSSGKEFLQQFAENQATRPLRLFAEAIPGGAVADKISGRTAPAWPAAAGLLLLVFLITLALYLRLRRKNQALAEEIAQSRSVALRARKKERETAEIYNDLNDYLFFHDLDGNFKEANASALRESGYSIEQWRKTNLRQIVPESYKAACDAYLARILENGTDRGYMRVVTPDREILVLEYNNSLVYDSGGHPVGVRGIARNITKQLHTRKALQESEKKYRTILDSIEDGYYEVDLVGNMTFFNNAFMRMLGFSAEEIKGKNYRSMVCGSDKNAVYQTFNYVFRTGKPVKTFDWKLIRNDGDFCYVETSVSLNLDKSGVPIGFRGILRDITQRVAAENKRATLEAQLQQSQKLESIGTLAGGIAHDFNNILFPLMGYTEMAIETLPEDSRARKNMEKVLISAERAKELVKQILIFSRQRADQGNDPVHIQPVIKETVRLLRNTVPSTIKIHEQIEDRTGPVQIPVAQIHQVIMNLCTNAFQAMEQQGNGHLTVSLEQLGITPETSAEHRHLTPGNYVRISVIDTGEGIAPEYIDKIFEPYFTTKPQEKGTGLGLSVSYGIIRNAGGILTVESRPGNGSRFSVYLPLASEDHCPPETTGYTGPLPTGHEHVLIVDDEHRIVELEQQILESLGYRTYPRTSSIEALEAFRYDPGKFDLVLTDQTMPNMTGLELARSIHEIRSDIPIVLCTGYSEKITPEKLKAIGIRALLMKPIARTDIAVTLRRILDEGNGGPAAVL